MLCQGNRFAVTVGIAKCKLPGLVSDLCCIPHYYFTNNIRTSAGATNCCLPIKTPITRLQKLCEHNIDIYSQISKYPVWKVTCTILWSLDNFWTSQQLFVHNWEDTIDVYKLLYII